MLETYACQLKFVVAEPADLDDVAAWLAEFPEADPRDVYLMPQGTDAAALREKLAWLRPAAAERGWSVTPRLHIELFGNTRGT